MVKGVVLIATLILCLSVLRSIKPEFFAAYDQRSSGTEERTHSAEIEERVMGDVFGWTTWMFDQGSMQLLFGNGLGVMSNGSDKISGYASDIRSRLWTETDIATVAWEGGLYLIVLWYGFRIWVMISVFRIWRSIKVKSMGVALSFLLAYIMIIGSYGTISSQPPLAIWWWLSVGSFFTIGNYYLDIRKRYIVSKN